MLLFLNKKIWALPELSSCLFSAFPEKKNCCINRNPGSSLPSDHFQQQQQGTPRAGIRWRARMGGEAQDGG